MIFNRDVLIGISLALLLALGVGGVNYWKKYKERKLDELSAIVYQYQKGKLSKEEARKKLKGSKVYPYFLALSGGNPSEIAGMLEDENLRSLYLEKEAYLLYSKGNYDRSLSILKIVEKERFNYPSALLLKAFNFERKGNKEGAKGIYKTLAKEYPDTYFGRIASAFLISER